MREGIPFSRRVQLPVVDAKMHLAVFLLDENHRAGPFGRRHFNEFCSFHAVDLWFFDLLGFITGLVWDLIYGLGVWNEVNPMLGFQNVGQVAAPHIVKVAEELYDFLL